MLISNLYLTFSYVFALTLGLFCHKYIYKIISNYGPGSALKQVLSGFFIPISIIINRIVGRGHILDFLHKTFFFISIPVSIVFVIIYKQFYTSLLFVDVIYKFLSSFVFPSILAVTFFIIFRYSLIYALFEMIHALAGIFILKRQNIGFYVYGFSSIFLICTVIPIIGIIKYCNVLNKEALLIFYFVLIVLFAKYRTMYGMLTKISDVCADLYGKINKKMQEDSFSNPFSILDISGDLIGDLFGTYSSLFIMLIISNFLSMFSYGELLIFIDKITWVTLSIPFSFLIFVCVTKIFNISFINTDVYKINNLHSCIIKLIVSAILSDFQPIKGLLLFSFLFLSRIILEMLNKSYKILIFPYFNISLTLGINSVIISSLGISIYHFLFGAIGFVSLVLFPQFLCYVHITFVSLYISHLFEDIVGIVYDNLGAVCSFIKDDDLRKFADSMDNYGNFCKWESKIASLAITATQMFYFINFLILNDNCFNLTFASIQQLNNNNILFISIILSFLLALSVASIFILNALIPFNNLSNYALKKVSNNNKNENNVETSCEILNNILSFEHNYYRTTCLDSFILSFGIISVVEIFKHVVPIILIILFLIFTGFYALIGTFGFLSDFYKKLMEEDSKSTIMIKERAAQCDAIGDPMKDTIAPYILISFQTIFYFCIVISTYKKYIML